MTRNRNSFIIIVVVAVVVSACCLPLAIRGGRYYYVLHKFLKVPGVRERIAVQPTKRTLTPVAAVHPVNLGYATFDTGSTNPISIEAVASGAALLLKSGDVQMFFFLPFGPEKAVDATSASGEVAARDARKYPHMCSYLEKLKTDFVAAEMEVEEIQLAPLSKVLFMNSDDFLLYITMLGQKATFSRSLNEVQFFESPEAKGIVRIGERAKDRRVAFVCFSSLDGTRKVGLRLNLAETSSEDIAGLLDPILRSFRFTTDSVDDKEKIKSLIREAGIPQEGASQ